jgi:hypothetical protein
MNDRHGRPERKTGKDGGGALSDVDIIAMTIRHGPNCTRLYLDSLARFETCEEDSHA